MTYLHASNGACCSNSSIVTSVTQKEFDAKKLKIKSITVSHPSAFVYENDENNFMYLTYILYLLKIFE